eukprot:2775470-Pleurochrysis_carterae.AAC.1
MRERVCEHGLAGPGRARARARGSARVHALTSACAQALACAQAHVRALRCARVRLRTRSPLISHYATAAALPNQRVRARSPARASACACESQRACAFTRVQLVQARAPRLHGHGVSAKRASVREPASGRCLERVHIGACVRKW